MEWENVRAVLACMLWLGCGWPGGANAQPAAPAGGDAAAGTAAAPPLAGARLSGSPAAAGGWRAIADPRQRFAFGNRTYQDGRFGEAAAVYASLLDEGYESPALYLNLGNALIQAGELGEAIVAYRRGLRLSPRDRDLETNLAYARSLTVDVLPEESTSPFLERLAALVRSVSSREALWAATGLYWLSASVLLLARLAQRGRRLVGIALWILVPAFGLAAGLAFERARSEWRHDLAVILVETVDVRTGPGEDYATRLELHEGTTVRVRRAAERWLEVELTDELSGWVPEGSLSQI